MGLFKSDTVNKFWDIAIAYNNVAGSQVIELLHNNPHQIRQFYGLEGVKGCSNGLLSELRCYASISSLAEVGLPSISNEDDESQKLTKATSYEWGSARFELEVLRRAEGSPDWVECGVAALKNAGGFRYRIHRLLDLVTDNIGAQVGEWGRIGVRIKTVGYGYPQAYDRISFTGNWTQEFTWVQEHPTYVVINQYGGGFSPTPTPTPTPPPVPTLTLSLASGSTSAIANDDEKINLVISNIPVGTQLSGSWFKNGIDTQIIETVTVSESANELSTLKLRDTFSGNYSLRLFYNDGGYVSNGVAVTINPELILSLPSGITSAKTGEATAILIQGKYFPTGVSITGNWEKDGASIEVAPVSLVVSPENTVSVNQTAAQFQAKGSGNYRLRFIVNGETFYSNAISVEVTLVLSIAISPTSLNLSNYYSYALTATISGMQNSETYTLTWLKAGVELTGTSSNRTFAANTQGNMLVTFSTDIFKNSPYNGGGIYKLKLTKGSNSVLSNDFTLNDIRSTESSPALG